MRRITHADLVRGTHKNGGVELDVRRIEGTDFVVGIKGADYLLRPESSDVRTTLELMGSMNNGTHAVKAEGMGASARLELLTEQEAREETGPAHLYAQMLEVATTIEQEYTQKHGRAPTENIRTIATTLFIEHTRGGDF